MRRQSLALLGLAVALFSCCILVTDAAVTEVFIAPNHADTAGCGSEKLPCGTLAGAQALLGPGGTIFVLPGEYKRQSPSAKVWVNQDLNIVGYDPSFNSTVRNSRAMQQYPRADPLNHVFNVGSDDDSGEVWWFEINNNATVYFLGVTFTGLNGYSAGVTVMSAASAVAFENCNFLNMRFSVGSVQGSRLSFLDVRISGSSGSDAQFISFGAEMDDPHFNESTLVSFRNTEISNSSGVGMSIDGCAVVTAVNLTLRDLGIGVMLSSDFNPSQRYGVMSVTLQDSLIANCSKPFYTYTIGVAPRVELSLDNCDLVDNGVTAHHPDLAPGPVVSLSATTNNDTVKITNSRFLNNANTDTRFDWRGGALFCGPGAIAVLSNVSFVNTASLDGGIAWCSPNCTMTATAITARGTTETQNTGPCAGLPQ